MNLLLLLTALFASLTGIGSAERSLRAVPGVAVVQAAEAAHAAVQPARRAIPDAEPWAVAARTDPIRARAESPALAARLPFERRLE